jgi:predicted O-methyltransferase YrrM
MGLIPAGELVAVDYAHAQLIQSLVQCEKPHRLLECGVGSGLVTEVISEAMRYNGHGTLTLVDNWLDWDGQEPPEVKEHFPHARVITMSEGDFVASCTEQFDFMMMDADHAHGEEFFWDAYHKICSPGGVMIYHDINLFWNDWPNLRKIYDYVRWDASINYRLFNKSSRPDEKCERGLLVIWKPA